MHHLSYSHSQSATVEIGVSLLVLYASSAQEMVKVFQDQYDSTSDVRKYEIYFEC